MDVIVGQIWKDNYRYGTPGWERYVKIIAIEGDTATIKTCSKTGVDSGNRSTKTKLKRFNGKTDGFSVVNG